MTKITLITPPDFFENDVYSVLFINITEAEQDESSNWLGNLKSDKHLNIYYYQGEPHIEWLLFALNRADAVYINADTESDVTRWLMSFVLSKSNVYYRTDNQNLKSLFSYINQKNIDSITKFLEVNLGQ